MAKLILNSSLRAATVGVLFALVGVAICCAALEGTIRFFQLWYIPDYSKMTWYEPSPFASPPAYVVKHGIDAEWGLGRIRSNNLIRDTHPTDKPPGVFRILALGDSITFGFGVDQKDSYPAKLEALLNHSVGRRFEVINAGIPGYNIVDESNLGARLVDLYSPDLIIWTLIPNDYDDSLGVDSEGKIAFSKVDYVSNVEALRSWGFDCGQRINIDNFRNSMNEETRNWADGVAAKSSRFSPIDLWLGQNSFIYSFVVSRVHMLTGASNPLKPGELQYRGANSVAYASIFSSPRSLARANAGIKAFADLATKKAIPVVLLNTEIPIDKMWRGTYGTMKYFDAPAYLHQDFYPFQVAHSLGWDGHFSPEGAGRFAEAMSSLLKCNGYIAGDKNCETVPADEAFVREEWDSYSKGYEEFKRATFGSIDFDQFKGIHQILGGIFPPRVFPGHLARRANFLLPGGAVGSIEILGTLQGASPLKFDATIFVGQGSFTRSITVQPGEVKLSIDLPKIQMDNSDPIELELNCKVDPCPPMRLKSISSKPVS